MEESEITTLNRKTCEALDAQDPLWNYRARFCLPESTIYLDGNSLGALPARTTARIAEVVREEWGNCLIGSWNTHGWITLPQRVGAKLSGLLGANETEVIVTDSTVPVGTGDEIPCILAKNGAPEATSVTSNPKFLRENAAIRDFKIPDRIVVGDEDDRTRDVL